MITVKECKSGKELTLFERVPEILHSHVPAFVPPFPGSVKKLVKPGGAFKTHGTVQCFIAYKDGKPVGRIAAIKNNSHNKFHNDRVGFFGFFDFIDDAEVSKALWNAALAAIQVQGFEVIRGPYNPSINDEVGALIENFEDPPFLLMTYNPAYYVKHFEALGLALGRRLFAYYLSADTIPPERIEKIVDRVRKRSGITLRHIDMKNLERELKIIHRLYNETLVGLNWGSYPLAFEDVEAGAKDFKAFIDPSMILFAEKDGHAVGFSFTLPDINQFLQKTKKMPRWFRSVYAVAKILTSRPTRARLAILGVEPEYRNRGLGALFYYESLIRGKQRYTGGELSWVDEGNDEMGRAIEMMGGNKYRTYGIFEQQVRA